jgi:transcriptional regulator with PAS, ATPase and Fis domain
MNILLTFTGFHDPYAQGLVGGEEQPGPVLSLLSARAFDRVYLFSTPTTEEVTEATRAAMANLYPKMEVEILGIPLDDPTDYPSILNGLRHHYKQIQDELSGARLYIAVASGTPQMHACWVLLSASGEIPARILHVRPPQYVTRKSPLVTEIDLTSPEFPTVRTKTSVGPEMKEIHADLDSIIAQLGIVGDHPSMKKAIETAAMLAPSNGPVLIYGETGTGKELFARLIHRLSERADGEFVPINCAAIPGELVESILFGHRKGSFTGAVSDQDGKFVLAHRGTLFLDELGELPIPAQAKLLRVLQDGEVEPVGAKRPQKVDARVVGATNRDLRRLIRRDKFREDLFYRLNVGEIVIPPLRERRSDIPAMALHILDEINHSLKLPKQISPEALRRLQEHNWPGNVRDLENVIERSARLCRERVMDADDLLITDPVGYADPLKALPEPYEGFSMEKFLGSARKQMILRALEASGGNQSRAARMLGITPQAINKFLKQSGTDVNQGENI